jgi:hypothetical protein
MSATPSPAPSDPTTPMSTPTPAPSPKRFDALREYYEEYKDYRLGLNFGDDGWSLQPTSLLLWIIGAIMLLNCPVELTFVGYAVALAGIVTVGALIYVIRVVLKKSRSVVLPTWAVVLLTAFTVVVMQPLASKLWSMTNAVSTTPAAFPPFFIEVAYCAIVILIGVSLLFTRRAPYTKGLTFVNPDEAPSNVRAIG